MFEWYRVAHLEGREGRRRRQEEPACREPLFRLTAQLEPICRSLV